MNPRFKIGILLLGVLVPLLGIGLIFGVISSRKKKIEQEYTTRKASYTANQRQKEVVKGLEVRMSKYDGRQDEWDVLLKNSDIGTVTGLLKEISAEYSGTETFRRREFNFVNTETGIGAASKQPSVSFTVSLAGTFTAIQQGLLSLESKMPNLSLNSMKIHPDPGSSLLEVELSYSAWKQ